MTGTMVADDVSLERARWRTIVVSLLLSLGLTVYAWATHAGPWAAWATALLVNGLLLAHVVHYRDELLGKLLLMGVVAGFAELPSDWFSVGAKGVLFYPQVGPFIWTSPAYMPLGYSLLIVQFGFIGRWLDRKHGLLVATVVMGLIGGLNVPFYEYLARDAGFWSYAGVTELLGVVPYYIIVGEVALAAALPFMARRLERSGWVAPLGWGVVEGAIMFVAWAGAFELLH